MKNAIKKINIIILIMLILGLAFAHNTQAVGNVFSDADKFLSKRRLSK